MKTQTFRNLENPKIHWKNLIQSLCEFTHAKVVVEIGVQNGITTEGLCLAAAKHNGMVFGYDIFEPHGTYNKNEGSSSGNLELTLFRLQQYNNKKITKINTQSVNFKKILKKDIKPYGGEIHFAFIDGDHSYEGAKKDFLNIYPLLSLDGVIILHDTFSHIGLRKLVIDLEKMSIKKSFSLINLPFGSGNKRVGLTIITKKSYAMNNNGITNIDHDPMMITEEVYSYEQKWYNYNLQGKK